MKVLFIALLAFLCGSLITGFWYKRVVVEVQKDDKPKPLSIGPEERKNFRSISGFKVLPDCDTRFYSVTKLEINKMLDGEWKGQTSQGQAMSFNVSNGAITDIRIGYSVFINIFCNEGTSGAYTVTKSGAQEAHFDPLTHPAAKPSLEAKLDPYTGRFSVDNCNDTGRRRKECIFVTGCFEQSGQKAIGTYEMRINPELGYCYSLLSGTWTASKQ